jgi:hypothetical protein
MAVHKAMWDEKKRARKIAFYLLAVLAAVLIGVLAATKPAHASTTFTVDVTATSPTPTSQTTRAWCRSSVGAP